jgi:hypothetical protein
MHIMLDFGLIRVLGCYLGPYSNHLLLEVDLNSVSKVAIVLVSLVIDRLFHIGLTQDIDLNQLESFQLFSSMAP